MPALPRSLTRGSLALGSLALGLVTVVAPPAAATDELPPGRTIVEHVAQPGDTATGLATRYRAWTRELIELNDLGPGASIVVGQELRIPVVDAVADSGNDRSATKRRRGTDDSRARAAGTPPRGEVRATIARTARHHGVDADLALAVAWQESGWQQDVTSPAGAVGAMQVLPGTAEWMSLYAGRDLRPRDLQDNATAGVLLLGVLADQTAGPRRQVAAYYQGLGAVREHGLYEETRPYVRNVRAIRGRLARGLPPSG